MNNIFTLLIIYQIKHFICDYPLQTPYMLGKFKDYPDFIKPLTAHAAVHALATFSIALLYKPELAVILGLTDGVIHFIVDRIKASPKLLGRFTALSKSEMSEIISYQPIRVPGLTHEEQINIRYADKLKSNVYFWWALGADQMAHHLTHYFLIWMMVK